MEKSAEDAFEPNNSIRSAVPLKAGVEVSARAVQENPDVFSIEAPSGATVVFRLRSLGGVDCPEFAVMDSVGQDLYRDKQGFCTDKWPAVIVRAAGVSVSGKRQSGYEFRIPAASQGKYYIGINERRQADNLFPYSWDYALTAAIE